MTDANKKWVKANTYYKQDGTGEVSMEEYLLQEAEGDPKFMVREHATGGLHVCSVDGGKISVPAICNHWWLAEAIIDAIRVRDAGEWGECLFCQKDVALPAKYKHEKDGRPCCDSCFNARDD